MTVARDWLGPDLDCRMIAEVGRLEVNGVQGYHTPFDLHVFIRFSSQLPPGALVLEVGSFMGLSSLIMAKSFMAAGNYTARIHCVDTWEGSIEHQGFDFIKEGRLYDIFCQNIRKSGLGTFIVPVRSDSSKAAERYAEESLDMIFIDGDHSFEGCLKDLRAWYPKLKPGGIFFGHDGVDEVRSAVETFIRERDLTVTFLGVQPKTNNMYAIQDRENVYRNIYQAGPAKTVGG